MKKILLAAFAAASLTAGAQQVQGDFDAAWGKCIPWDSKNNKKESGTQPQGWKGSNVYASLAAVKVCTETAHDTGKAVLLTNQNMVGQKVPAYITLGTPWATAETNFAAVKEGSADGGAFGGIDFKWRPDGIRFQYMRDNSKGTERASVIAYIWNGTYTQKSVPGNTAVGYGKYGTATKVDMTDRDRNILGMSTLTGGEVSSTSGAACVAKIEEYITEAKSEWTTFEALFQGDGYSTADLSNAKLNIIISANDYFGDRNGIIADNSLTIDNVELIYYHALQNVSYDGEALTFDADNYCDLSSVSYDATKALTYTKVGLGATVEAPVFDAQTCRLSVTVKGNDFEANPESYTTYVVQFAKPVDVTPVVGPYSSALVIDFGEGGEPIPGVRVSLTEGTEPGTVNFELRDFDMGGGETTLGDIILPNIKLIDNGDGTYGFGENAPVHLELLGGGIQATATLNTQTSRVEGEDLTAHVDVMWVDDEGNPIAPIYVSAIGPKVHPLTLTDGRTVEAAAGAYDVTLTRSFAKGWNTLCLPFDVNPAEFGVEGVKVQEFAGADGSSLDFQAVETVTANVPCLVYFPEAVASGVTLLTKTIASLSVQPMRQGDFTFNGSYEGSISMSGKYGVADVDGVQKIMRGGSASTLKGTRAYFDYSGTGNVQGMRLSLEGEGTTGIGGIVTGAADTEAPLYDLSGRRVQNVTKGGIYIRNGKKIIK